MITVLIALAALPQASIESTVNNLRSNEPPAGTVSYAYDALNRLISQTDGEGHVTQFGYDGVGNRTSVTDGLGFVTSFSFDANDNLVAITDPLGEVATMTYDAEDNLISQTDAEGKTWTFAYDGLNRRVSQTDPLGWVTSYEYDAIGQQIRMTDENVVVTRFDFDRLGRMVTEVHNEQPGQPADHETNVTFNYSYDPVGNRISETDANGNATSYTYDPLYRLVQETDAENQITSYAYDALNQVWQLSYDAAHNRLDVIDPHGVVTYNEYDAVGNVATYEYHHTFHYDANDNRINGTDANGNFISVTDAIGNATTYAYDLFDRLISAIDPRGYDTGTNLHTDRNNRNARESESSTPGLQSTQQRMDKTLVLGLPLVILSLFTVMLTVSLDHGRIMRSFGISRRHTKGVQRTRIRSGKLK
ncbi:MAG: RHS repeat protein [Proteobacteria bacterium]|nr:RHS repeat protein [Pseudomonadota bacterium]